MNVVDAQQFALDVYPNSAEAAQILAGSCPPITTYVPDANTYPHTKTIDYGTGCTNAGGITRSGKTITYVSDDMANVGAQTITTYDNFFFNGVHMEGAAKIDHNLRKTGPPQNVYRLTQRDRKLTQPNGDYIIYSGSKRLEKLDANPVFPGFPNGWFTATGTIIGDELKGGVSYQWTATIADANPLVYKFCDFIVKGILNITFDNGDPAWSIDYGRVTDCDNLAQLTISGVTSTVTLPLTP